MNFEWLKENLLQLYSWENFKDYATFDMIKTDINVQTKTVIHKKRKTSTNLI